MIAEILLTDKELKEISGGRHGGHWGHHWGHGAHRYGFGGYGFGGPWGYAAPVGYGYGYQQVVAAPPQVALVAVGAPAAQGCPMAAVASC